MIIRLWAASTMPRSVAEPVRSRTAKAIATGAIPVADQGDGAAGE